MSATSSNSTFYIDLEEDEKDYDINIKDLTIGEIFEDGYFSKTYKGELKINNKKIPVIVKKAADSEDKTQKRMIGEEIGALIEIKRHPNILEFVGIVTDSGIQSIVFEYPDGENLQEFVRACRQKGTFNANVETEFNGFVLVDSNSEAFNNQQSLKTQHYLCTADLVSIALQIAKAMKYLTELSYVHRQLRLSSVLIKKDKTIRLTEFGLARKNNNHYYRIMHKENPLPHHWMAPENFDEKKFTEKSEIWSYAVCLWELFTLGDIPYQGVEDMLKYLSVGRRLPQPNYCSKEIYDFLKGCWDLDPSKRPTFSECVDFFEKQLEQFIKEQPLNKPSSNNA